MDAGPGGVLQRLGGDLDVLAVGPRQPADHTVADLLGDALHGPEIARRRDGKPGLDDVHPHLFQRAGDLDLFVNVQRCPRRLFPVAQGCIKDVDFSTASVHTPSRFGKLGNW